jgi:hypothetical protein
MNETDLEMGQGVRMSAVRSRLIDVAMVANRKFSTGPHLGINGGKKKLLNEMFLPAPSSSSKRHNNMAECFIHVDPKY